LIPQRTHNNYARDKMNDNEEYANNPSLLDLQWDNDLDMDVLDRVMKRRGAQPRQEQQNSTCTPTPWLTCANVCCKSIYGDVCCRERCLTNINHGEYCCEHAGLVNCSDQLCCNPILGECCGNGYCCVVGAQKCCRNSNNPEYSCYNVDTCPWVVQVRELEDQNCWKRVAKYPRIVWKNRWMDERGWNI